MRKRVLFSLIMSIALIIFSIGMCFYAYHYATSNRVGPIGDGQFHFKTIISFLFSGLSGICTLILSIIQANKDRKANVDLHAKPLVAEAERLIIGKVAHDAENAEWVMLIDNEFVSMESLYKVINENLVRENKPILKVGDTISIKVERA
ncbi:hypothetical protein [Paenibacillus sp. N3.4]|uniref:hypothetical protein n=1 Tax=Paenibacillus sp. N3.4 TaxID=2603222 RepID=UPI0011C91CFE|nr:hypothetical protein [Paenibacillus sp. N3.4]TXK83464.1 hypothetical protein FU659_13830 [Paenibacillus sp. N3.4]